MMRKSRALFRKARRLLPGGVNSPVRAFGAVGGCPPFIRRAGGSRVTDADGRAYVDYVMSWGPLILGHAPRPVVHAVQKAAARGTSYGAPTDAEVELALRIRRAIPSMQMLRMVSSGTEAGMSALRLARAATGREGIVKFEGGYHGHADPFLAKAGSGLGTFGISASPGVPRAVTRRTYTLPYNDPAGAKALFRKHGRKIAAVIVEPVAANMGVVLPEPGFLETLRTLCRRNGALLIFDEVVTGFRIHYGGVQTKLGIRPDLTMLGKIVGGGLPMGMFGGPSDLMKQLSPVGDVYQAGTLSGNPLAVAAGLATLKALSSEVYRRLEARSRQLAEGLVEAAQRRKVQLTINRAGSMMTLFFTGERVVDFASAARADRGKFVRFFHAMLDQGIILPPSPFEAWFVSAAHTEADIEKTIRAADAAFRRV